MLDGQENKMKTQIAISPGTQVKHERYGIGTVVKEWGSWLCCKVCLTPFEDEKRSRKCSVCKYEGEPFLVNSRGISLMDDFKRENEPKTPCKLPPLRAPKAPMTYLERKYPNKFALRTVTGTSTQPINKIDEGQLRRYAASL